METRKVFIYRWTGITTIGLFAGGIAALLLSWLLTPFNDYASNFISGFAIIFIMAATQAFPLQRLLPPREWMIAGIVSAVLFSTSAIVWNSIVVSFPISSSVNRLFIEFIQGQALAVMVGFCLAIPQWIVLRRYLSHAYFWIFGCLLACITIFNLLILPNWFNLRSIPFYNLTMLLLSPAIFGIITGFTLYTIIARKPKPKHVEILAEGL